MGTPRQKLRHGQLENVIVELFDDKIIDRAKICRLKSKFGKKHVNAIHAEGNFIFEFAQVSLLEAGAIADDESAFAFVNIFQLSQAPNAFTPPGMKIGGGQLRQAAKRIIGVTRHLKHWSWKNGFYSLFHKLL
jgi:hypothetical protein